MNNQPYKKKSRRTTVVIPTTSFTHSLTEGVDEELKMHNNQIPRIDRNIAEISIVDSKGLEFGKHDSNKSSLKASGTRSSYLPLSLEPIQYDSLYEGNSCTSIFSISTLTIPFMINQHVLD
jgi:hypothetical protein